MKIHQLRVLVACAEAGSLRAAADRLALTHPAVTKALKELEEEMKVPLVVRSSRGIELTRFGKALYHRSHQILEDMRRAHDEIRQLQGGVTGRVSIGVSGSSALIVMPRALKVFRQQMPDVEIDVIELPPKYIAVNLLDGSLDFFVTHAPQEIDPECEQRVLRKGRLFVTARRGHPAADCRTLRGLLAYEWLFPRQNIDKSEFTDLFANNGIEAPGKIVSCQSSLLALGLLIETDALALFPLPYIAHSVTQDRLCTLTIEETLPEVSASIITRRGVQLTPAARECRDVVQKVIEDQRW
ncbi:HTH-type transcriptional regulator TsaR [Pandoraea terrae]|uniref:HTH-type transcriptional regulator TsaR n=1 Tax=Pandoraea terrae TaxID=1537710 RepID=A0A5E4T372_9BURK|nr:LysR substrate-binding domain-containing protein [Pandoraea terrae]VVD80469.1 HTH-type transcriptional regulator TsaR [Pandoraea terrae]